ncbi:hypothetical protein Pfo_011200 [Paulownia fortunei]|nr:hypothetical protein Pfo_011200 [Paulownia fortunei]
MEQISLSMNKKCMRNFIDQLPDEVLITIVSHLPVIEAGRTSVLARRWRYFWMFNSVLIFDASRVLCNLEERGTLLESERIRFVKWVNRVLNLHSSATIEEFRILFNLDEGYANDIDKWVEFAFAKRVKRLELNLVDSHTGIPNEPYTFPNMCRPIKRLRILPPGLSNCELLLTLSLTEVDVTGEVLEFFISNCPFLEELCVKESGRLKILRPSSPSIRLRRLEIVNCQGFRSLEICSPNLLSFTFYGDRIPMVLKNVSSLISLSLGAIVPGILTVHLVQISGCLSRLETLMLHTSALREYEVLPKSPELPRLKKLILDIHANGRESLLCFTPLINSAPLLREIVLKLTWSEPVIHRTIRSAKGHRHHCLEVLQIVGFSGAAIDVELAQYVLENAVSLKKMVIDFHRPLAGQEADAMGVAQMAMAREGVRLLKAKLPAGVELIML